MKVLHVIPSYYPAFVYGGPIRTTHQLNLALAEQGVTVRVLTTDANGMAVLPESGKTVAYGPNLSVHYAPRTFAPDVSLSLLWELPSAIRWADVVHLTAVYSFTTLPTLFWCRVWRKPVFWSPRGALQEWHASPKRRVKKVWDLACRKIAASNTTIVAASSLESGAARVKFATLQTIQIENGVEVKQEVQHVTGEALRILFLGRVHPIKGLENLIRACALLGEVAWELAVAGPGDQAYTDSLKLLVQDLGIAARVRFIGEVAEEEKDRVFSASDILVLPSYSENFGLVVAEALAHEVPVIASKGTPWGELEKRNCGLWCENDAQSLATALRKMAALDRRELGRRGRAWMQADFDWDRQAAKQLRYYENALKEGHG